MNFCLNNQFPICRRRATRRILAACLLAVAPIAGAGFSPPAELIIATDVNYPPYYSRTEDGRGQGIVVDKWALWSKRTGVPVRVEATDWAVAQSSVQNGSRDVLDPVSYTEPRASLYEFSKAYAPVEARVYFDRSITGISDVASMGGFTIGAKKGSACANWLAERGIDNFRLYPTSESLVRAAGTGEVRLFCMDSISAQYFLFKFGFSEQFRETPRLYSTTIRWAVKKGRTGLRDFIQQGFDQITPEELAEIDARWYGSAVEFPLSTRFLIYGVIAGAVLLSLGMLLVVWNRLLSRQVGVRTAELHTAMRLLQADAERIQVLYNSAPCGYHSLNADGVFVSVNDTELEWLGQTREEIVGKRKFSDFLGAQGSRDFAINYPIFLREGEIRDVEYEIVRDDGRVTSILLSAKMVRDAGGKALMSSATLHDITERKNAEDKVRQLNTELERRIEERTAQLSAANEELSAFSYSLSHDLRGPLRAIDGFSKLVLEHSADRLDELGRSYLARVRRASKRLGMLIDDMLKLSRVSFAEPVRSNVDLSQMAREIAAEFSRSTPERAVRFQIGNELFARGDPGLVRIVLENLIGNAWKYTSKHDQARIELGRMADAGEDIFFVKDDGVGFDMAYAEKLFAPFQRLHDTSDFEGTGIGLATVQRVIGRHRGRVWANGEVGRGATVFFTLGAG